jgi:two-component system cell cycle response regulator
MARAAIRLPDGQAIHVTLSIGVAIGRPSDGHNANSLIDRADRALYAAKNQGRNQVVMADTVTTLVPPGAPPLPQKFAQAPARDSSRRKAGG